MHAPPRYIVISATSFDGTTAFSPTLLNPKTVNPGVGLFPIPSQNEPRTQATVDGPTGRFSFAALLRSGRSPALIRVRAITPPNGGTWAFRSANALEQPLAVGPEGVDQLLSPAFELTQQWGEVHQAGPTDAIVVNLAAGNPAPQIEVEVTDMVGDIAALWLAAHKPCCAGEGGAGACETPTLPVEVPTGETNFDLSAWECGLNIIASVEDPGTTLTLPPIADVASGAWALLRRQGGAWFRVIADDGVNGKVPPDGVIFEDDDKAVLFRATTDGWSATDVVPQLQAVSVTTSIPVFAGIGVFNVDLEDSGDCTLPDTEDIAPGQLMWVTNTSDLGVEVTLVLANPLDETINGAFGSSIRLPNPAIGVVPGDTVLLMREDGARSGWRMVWSNFGRDQGLQEIVGNSHVFTAGWRGTQTVQFSSTATNIPVTLPSPALAPVGTRLHAFRSSDPAAPGVIPTITFDASLGGGFIVANGTVAATYVAAGVNVWSFLEYEGNGVWSYHNSGPTSELRDLVVEAGVNTPLAVAPFWADVTSISVTSDNDANVLQVPLIPRAEQAVTIFNAGTPAAGDIAVNFVGGTVNGAYATTTLAPGQSLVLRLHGGTVMSAVKGAAL